MKQLRCGECGSKHLEKENLRGREIPWGWNTSAIVAADIEVLVCQNCQNIIPNGKDLEILTKCVEIIPCSAVG